MSLMGLFSWRSYIRLKSLDVHTHILSSTADIMVLSGFSNVKG